MSGKTQTSEAGCSRVEHWCSIEHCEGQLPTLGILCEAITNKALRYLGTASLVFGKTYTSRLQAGSTDPPLELLMPLLWGHSQEYPALVQLVVMGVNWAGVLEVGIPSFTRLYQAIVYPVDLVHALVTDLGPHLDVGGLLQDIDGVNTLHFGFSLRLLHHRLQQSDGLLDPTQL